MGAEQELLSVRCALHSERCIEEAEDSDLEARLMIYERVPGCTEVGWLLSEASSLVWLFAVGILPAMQPIVQSTCLVVARRKYVFRCTDPLIECTELTTEAQFLAA